MNETELTARVERLERDNRRFKRFALAALILLVALVSIYATRPVPDKITAREFDVVDRQGNLRIKMGLGSLTGVSTGEPSIALLDETGKYREQMYLVWSGEPAMAFQDAPSADSAAMFLDTGGVTLYGHQGREMDIGSGGGNAKRTSASVNSIIMFGNDKQHHVIWQAP